MSSEKVIDPLKMYMAENPPVCGDADAQSVMEMHYYC